MSDSREFYHHGERQFKIPHDFGGSHPFGGGNPLLFSDYVEEETVDPGVLARGFDVSCLPSPGGKEARGRIMTRAADPSSGAAASGPPLTPNSSISSASTEAAGHDQHLDSAADNKEQQREGAPDEKPDTSKHKTTKPKKKEEKKQRGPRFAFLTKSDVDHLEDGYRWRKYGQKAVKNSPFPRSYYRCTTQKCSVKKRVERSLQDPSIVITTYEGQHTHQTPANLRASSHVLAAAATNYHPSSSTAPTIATGVGRQLPVITQQHQPMHPNLDHQGHGAAGTDPHHLTFDQDYMSSVSFLHPFQIRPGYGQLEDIVSPSIQSNQQ